VVESQLYLFLIGGVDVTSYVQQNSTIVRTRKATSGDSARLKLAYNVEDVLTITNGLDIVISRGDVTATEEYIFRGKLINFVPMNAIIQVNGEGTLEQLKNLLVTKSYDRNIDSEAGEVSAIAQNLIEDAGFTASVVASGTTSGDTTLDKFICKRDSYKDRLLVLGQLINYLVRYDYDNDYVRFEPRGYNSYANKLIVGDNVTNNIKWNVDISGMRNKISVEGAFEIDTRINNFNGDGATTAFTLVNTPESIKVTVDGTLQTLGVLDGSTGYDYALDKELKIITFVAGSIPGAGTNNVVVEYGVKVPYTSSGKNTASIATYNITQEASYTFNDIRTVDDSEARLQALLDALGSGLIKSVIITSEHGIKPGQIVEVEDSQHPNYNGEYVVQTVTTNYPIALDEIAVGDNDFEIDDLMDSINERLKLLEGDNDLLNEILRQLVEINFDSKLRSHYFKLNSFDITDTPTVLYWDNSIQGDWGEEGESYGFNWGDDVDDNDVNGTDIAIVQGRNKYNEFVQDSDFHDSTSTATFNTTTKQITFTSGQIWQSKIISKGFTPSAFTLTLGNLTGAVTTEISGDGGSTFQTVSDLNLRTNFTTADTTGIIIKITESAATAATLQPVYTTNNRFSSAAIFCYIE